MQLNIIRQFFIVLIVLTFGQNVYASQIVAYVNKEVITSIDLEQSMHIATKSDGRRFDNAQDQRQMLDELIDTKLIIEFCHKQKLKISDQDVSNTIVRMAAQNNLSVDEFYEMLATQDIDGESFNEYIHNKLILTAFENTFLVPKIEIKPEQISSERTRVVADLVEKSKSIESANISEIVIYKDKISEDSFTDLSQNIKNYIKKDGFATVAEAYSHSLNAEDGGAIGWVDFDEISDIYQALISSALEGDGVEVYEADAALLALKVDDVKYHYLLKKRDIDDTKVEHYLKVEEVEKQREEFADQLRQKAFVKIEY